MLSNSTRIVGLDYGRAAAALCVLLWHNHFFGQGKMFSLEADAPFLPSIADVLNANLLLQAVPFFIFMSCYLFVLRGPSWSSLSRRAYRLTVLHVFWGCAYSLVLGGIPALAAALSTFETRPVYAAVTAMGSFYFFSALLFTIALTHVAAGLSFRWLFVWGFVSIAAVAGMQTASVSYGVSWATAFWSPLNYLMMPPIAVLLVRHLKGELPSCRLIAMLACVFTVVVVAEWASVVDPVFTRNQGFAIPAYTRVSPAVFSCLAICVLLRIHRRPGVIVSFMARYALAAYCLQAFILASTSDLGIPRIPKTALDVVLTYFLAYVLSKLVLKDQLLASARP